MKIILLTAFEAGITKIDFTSLITSATNISLIVSSFWKKQNNHFQKLHSTVETIELSYFREKKQQFNEGTSNSLTPYANYMQIIISVLFFKTFC